MTTRTGPLAEEPPPHNLAAEEAVLGALLLVAQQNDMEALDSALAQLGREDFYQSGHRQIFSAIEALRRQEQVPDVVSVSDVLRRRGKDDAPPASYVTGLLGATYSPVTLSQHIPLLRECAAKRGLLELAGTLSHAAANGENPKALLALADRMLGTVRERIFDSSTIGKNDKTNNRATATELLTAPEPSRPWWPFLQREGVLGPGVVGLLSGYAKSGKTTATAHGLNAVLQACPDLQVTWCTEEARSLWRARLLRWRFDWPSVTFAFRSGMPWASSVAEIRRDQPDVVIIDTARAFLGIVDENDAGQWRTALDPLLLMARERDAAVLLLHHLRKSGGEDGLGHAGNHALVAAVDVALELRRDPQARQRRMVRAISRYDETPPAWVMELRDDGLAVLGDPSAIAHADLLSRLFGTLDNTLRTTAELVAELDDPKPSTGAVYAALKELHRQGRCDRSGSGTRGSPYRWKMKHPENDSSSSTPLRVEENESKVAAGA